MDTEKTVDQNALVAHAHKETSSRVSTIAARIMNAKPARDNQAFNSLLEDAQSLAGSCLSQDETPGQFKIPETFIDRLLDERETLQEKQEKLILFLGQGAPGASEIQRYLLPLQLCAMTMYGDILDRRLEDLGFPTGDLEPFYGPELDNVGMENSGE